jgi:transcriptional regulator with XRE-family HTH domain
MGLSQEAFGKPIDISQAHISDIEAGKKTPSPKLIRSICKFYGVSEKWIVNGEGKLEENIRQSNETCEPHAGWEPSITIEEMVGIPKGLGMAGAVDLLGRIYASRNELLIRSTFCSLQTTCLSLEERAARISLETRIAALELAIKTKNNSTHYYGPERRSGIKRRAFEDPAYPADQNRRSGLDRRTASP